MTQINNLKDLTEKKIYPVNTQLRKRNRNHIVLPELKNTKDTYNCFNKKKYVVWFSLIFVGSYYFYFKYLTEFVNIL